MTTLIIDNKKGYGRKLMRLLESKISGCVVSLKCTVLEGLAELRHPDYELLIIGHQLVDISIDEFLTILKNNGIMIPVVIIEHEKSDNSLIAGDSPESCVYKISSDDVPRVLPMMALEAHKRCLLYKENLTLKNELRKSQRNNKIVEISLNGNHKINNPLMTILGNTQLLIRDCETSDTKSMARLDKIEKAAKRIQEITLDIANNLGVNAEPREMLKSSK